jgi:hypothetical protein
MTTRSTSERLCALNLLNWNVLSVGRQRGWVTPSDLSRFATSCLAAGVNDEDLPAVAALASATKLCVSEVDELLAQLRRRGANQDSDELDSWRLARLLELQAQDLEWEEKVTHLEEIAAEFGYPADMQQCSRYSTGTSDPLDEMASLIDKLKARLCVK